MLYLASPYTYVHSNHNIAHRVQRARWQAICIEAGMRMKHNTDVYCPIAMGHAIVENYSDTPTSRAFWTAQSLAMLRFASRMEVVMFPGYKDSSGIHDEHHLCKLLNTPVIYSEPSDEALRILSLTPNSSYPIGEQ